jgi:SAM-dependent methyltransferase
MDKYDERTFGDRFADVYDHYFSELDEAAIDLLEELAAGRRVLELGIGTGRIALPLHQRGVQISGVDASPAMIAKLREKPGGDQIEVHQGSFVELPMRDRFSLIFVAFNTLFALLTQEEQLSCLRSVASHLEDDGLFLVEAFVPDLCRFDRGQTVRASNLTEGEALVELAQVDRATQQICAQLVALSNSGVGLYPIKLRYIWPSELDLMARLAGLQLRHRWGGWQKQGYDQRSEKHISVYALSA